jgi:hypothetical protein
MNALQLAKWIAASKETPDLLAQAESLHAAKKTDAVIALLVAETSLLLASLDAASLLGMLVVLISQTKENKSLIGVFTEKLLADTTCPFQVKLDSIVALYHSINEKSHTCYDVYLAAIKLTANASELASLKYLLGSAEEVFAKSAATAVEKRALYMIASDAFGEKGNYCRYEYLLKAMQTYNGEPEHAQTATKAIKMAIALPKLFAFNELKSAIVGAADALTKTPIYELFTVFLSKFI